MESLALIIENLLNVSASPETSIKIKNEIKNVYKSIFENFDELQVQPINSEEIEKAANNLLQQMFNGEMPVSQLVKKLIEYQKSSNPKETEIYACLTHSILDEYRFYHQYPEKHLKIAAELFGQLINNKLVEGVVETIALKYILESIKKGSGPLFTFGIIALNQFINRIYCWGNYLNTLLEMPKIKENSELYDNLINVYNENAKKNGLPLKVNEEALKKQTVVQGIFKCESSTDIISYVEVEGFKKDIRLNGRVSQNRAFDGDEVIVEINPKNEWFYGDGATPDPDNHADRNEDEDQKKKRLVMEAKKLEADSPVYATGHVVSITKHDEIIDGGYFFRINEKNYFRHNLFV